MISISFSVNFNFKLSLERNLEFKFNSYPLITNLDCWLNLSLINLILINSNNFFKDRGKSLKTKKFLSVILLFNNNLWSVFDITKKSIVPRSRLFFIYSSLSIFIILKD